MTKRHSGCWWILNGVETWTWHKWKLFWPRWCGDGQSPIFIFQDSPWALLSYRLQGITKPVRANHLAGKKVIESHARSVTLFLPLSAATCRDKNWCSNSPGKPSFGKENRQSCSVWQAGLASHLRNQSSGTPKFHFCTEGLELTLGPGIFRAPGMTVVCSADLELSLSSICPRRRVWTSTASAFSGTSKALWDENIKDNHRNCSNCNRTHIALH